MQQKNCVITREKLRWYHTRWEFDKIRALFRSDAGPLAGRAQPAHLPLDLRGHTHTQLHLLGPQADTQSSSRTRCCSPTGATAPWLLSSPPSCSCSSPATPQRSLSTSMKPSRWKLLKADSFGQIVFYFISKMVRHGERVHPTWVMMLVKVNHLLLTINSATNILLYSYKVRYFGNKTEVFFTHFEDIAQLCETQKVMRSDGSVWVSGQWLLWAFRKCIVCMFNFKHSPPDLWQF